MPHSIRMSRYSSAPETVEDVSDRIGLGINSCPEQAITNLEIEMTGSNEQDLNRADLNYKNVLRNLAMGAAALGAMGIGAWKYLGSSGRFEHLKPSVYRPIPIDNVERIISWNMAGQAARRHKQIRTLAARYSADVIDLQEVDTSDVAILHHDFPSWHLVYALADQKQHLPQGGYGNVQMTRQDPTNIRTRSFAGTSLIESAVGTVTGLTADAVSFNNQFTATKNGWQERRVALAATTKVLSAGKLVDIRTIDVHISGNTSVHSKQMGGVMDFVNDNLDGSKPLVVCGDFNADNAEVTSNFAKRGMVTPTKTGLNANYNGDYCSYYIGGQSSLAQVSVLNDYKTDHYPLEFSWTLK